MLLLSTTEQKLKISFSPGCVLCTVTSLAVTFIKIGQPMPVFQPDVMLFSKSGKSHDRGHSAITRERVVQVHNTLSRPGLQGPSQQSCQNRHQLSFPPRCDCIRAHSPGRFGPWRSWGRWQLQSTRMSFKWLDLEMVIGVSWQITSNAIYLFITLHQSFYCFFLLYLHVVLLLQICC